MITALLMGCAVIALFASRPDIRVAGWGVLAITGLLLLAGCSTKPAQHKTMQISEFDRCLLGEMYLHESFETALVACNHLATPEELAYVER